MEVICTKCGHSYYINEKKQNINDILHEDSDCHGGKVIPLELSYSEYATLCRMSTTPYKIGTHVDMDLYYAMVDLKKKDPIEYNLKMAQFRSLEEQKKSAKASNLPHCPHCNSTNLKKIGTLGRAASVGFWGLASKKIGKQWHCNSCGSDF